MSASRSRAPKDNRSVGAREGKWGWSQAVSFLSVLVATGAVVVSCVSAEASQHAADASQQQVELAERGQFDDRFNRAVQQLGDRDSIDIRQGGIHSLESLLMDSPRHHPTVLKQLASFIREHSPVSACTEGKGVPNDIREALGVIGHHNIRPDTHAAEYSVDLRGTCLSGVDLVRTDFVRAYFAGADLSGSDLTGADFTGANFLSAKMGRVNAVQANFTCAALPKANLEESFLVAARFVGADMIEAHLTRALLSGADLTDAVLDGAVLDPKQLDDPHILKTPTKPFCLTEGQYPGLTRG
ncbi:hypothetical protein Amsp01_044220 [Amycolatopsis sp. NBRC 101858]|nr:hypothetical protein Amsp01_044220 [Amycolatopsis sp. NBRC 101858]